MFSVLDIECVDKSLLAKFYENNNDFYKNLIVLLDEDMIQKLSIIGSKIIILYDEDGESDIIGSLISIPIVCVIDKDIYRYRTFDDIDIFDIDFISCYDKKSITDPKKTLCYDKDICGISTFLCVKKDKRKLNNAQKLINGLLKFGLDHDLKLSYQLTQIRISDFSIPINTWYIPVNIYKMIAEEWIENDDMNNFDQMNFFNEEYLIDRILPHNKHEKSSREFYINKTKNFKIRFLPLENIWRKWIDVFDSYLIISEQNNDIIGFFSYMICDIKIRDITYLKVPYLLLYAGDENIVIKNICKLLYNKNFSVIYIYEIQNMDFEILSSFNGVKLDSQSWFSFYNCDKNDEIMCTSKDICVPIL